MDEEWKQVGVSFKVNLCVSKLLEKKATSSFFLDLLFRISDAFVNSFHLR